MHLPEHWPLWKIIAVGYCEWTNGDWPDDEDIEEARAPAKHIAGYVERMNEPTEEEVTDFVQERLRWIAFLAGWQEASRVPHPESFGMADIDALYRETMMPEKKGYDDCPFCRIADGDPDGQVLARAFGCMIFAPINPVTDGHALVVPEVHVEDFAANPAVSGAAMMAASAWVLGGGEYNVITSKGAAATQTVRHLHLHIVPRRDGDGLALPWVV